MNVGVSVDVTSIHVSHALEGDAEVGIVIRQVKRERSGERAWGRPVAASLVGPPGPAEGEGVVLSADL
jgi:hypothetical protein